MIRDRQWNPEVFCCNLQKLLEKRFICKRFQRNGKVGGTLRIEMRGGDEVSKL